jgi:membrane protein insertase Oxa1/YidC/SpoIIIJ
LVNFAYPALQHLGWMKEVSHNIHHFDNTLVGVVDLGRAAINKGGGIYWPAMLIVAASAVAQYYQSKQLLPVDKEQRSLKTILREAGRGRQAEQSEVNAAVGRSTIYFLPVMVFIFTVGLPSALSLYWLTGGLVAYIQQSAVLNQDEAEMETMDDGQGAKKDAAKIPEAEIVTPKAKKTSTPSSKKSKKRRKRR